MSKRSHHASQAKVASADQPPKASRLKGFFSCTKRQICSQEKPDWGKMHRPRLYGENDLSLSAISPWRAKVSETGSLVCSGEAIKQSVASTNSALGLCELGVCGIIIQPFVPAAGNANLAQCDCCEEETRKKSVWLELASLAALRKPARGREGGGAEIMEKYGGRKGGKDMRSREKWCTYTLAQMHERKCSNIMHKPCYLFRAC